MPEPVTQRTGDGERLPGFELVGPLRAGRPSDAALARPYLVGGSTAVIEPDSDAILRELPALCAPTAA